MHPLRHEDLASRRGGLRTCGNIHHRADRGQITMGVTELAEATLRPISLETLLGATRVG